MLQLRLSPLILTLLLSQPLLADTLMLDSIENEATNSQSGLLRPNRGMAAQQVFEQFGEPLEEKAAIGNPPITRWLYNDFTVYFEYQHVIRSTLNKKSRPENEGEPLF